MSQGLLEHRAQERIVANHERPLFLLRGDPIGYPADQGNVDQAIERVGRCLDQDHPDAPLRQGAVGSGCDCRGIDAVQKPTAAMPNGARVRARSVSVPP